MKNLSYQLERQLPLQQKRDIGVEPKSGRAAVAIMIREEEAASEMLMIRRATREGDPWSGHMGFPGGRRDAEDDSNLSCALRETREELGIDLSECATPLGALSDVNTGWRRDRPEILVTPFVFRVETLPDLTPNHEVAGWVWVPLHFLMDHRNREPHNWEWRGQKMSSDSYHYDNHRIWGLSLMMIDEMVGIIQAPATD